MMYRLQMRTLYSVILTTPFEMAETEVTNQQYADLAQWAYDLGYCSATEGGVYDALDGSTRELVNLDEIYGYLEISFSDGRFTVDAGKESNPVLDMNWYGSVAYCDWLSL